MNKGTNNSSFERWLRTLFIAGNACWIVFTLWMSSVQIWGDHTDSHYGPPSWPVRMYAVMAFAISAVLLISLVTYALRIDGAKYLLLFGVAQQLIDGLRDTMQGCDQCPISAMLIDLPLFHYWHWVLWLAFCWWYVLRTNRSLPRSGCGSA